MRHGALQKKQSCKVGGITVPINRPPARDGLAGLIRYNRAVIFPQDGPPVLEHAGPCNFALTLPRLSRKFARSRLQSWKAASGSANGGHGRHRALCGGASDIYGDGEM